MVTDRHTDTHTQNDYCNPAAHAHRVNNSCESSINQLWNVQVYITMYSCDEIYPIHVLFYMLNQCLNVVAVVKAGLSQFCTKTMPSTQCPLNILCSPQAM